ncbi:MAG: hypothetical protein ABI881_17200 [Betaproteobacteria bacterium]
MIHLDRLLPRALSCAALSFALLAVSPARADTDYTDAWFGGSAQGGWGLAFTQADYAIYAQFFHYDASHNPVWFGGTIYRVSDGHYNGALYTVNGDYYGHMPYDPTLFHATPVGTIDFNATDASHGLLSYSINGVNVLTQIQRLTLVNIPIAGNYYATISQSFSSACSGGATTDFGSLQFVITQTGSPGNVSVELRDTVAPFDTLCTMTGAATQAGKVIDIANATNACGGTTFAPLHLYDIRRTANNGIEGRWQTLPGDACVNSARFVGIIQ